MRQHGQDVLHVRVYGPRSTSCRSINTQKKTWPISSHLDFMITLGQKPIYLNRSGMPAVVGKKISMPHNKSHACNILNPALTKLILSSWLIWASINHVNRGLVNIQSCWPHIRSTTHVCYMASPSLNKMSTVTGWFLVTCPWSNSNVSRPGYNCTVVARTPSLFVFAIWLFKRKSKNIKKNFMYGPSGN